MVTQSDGSTGSGGDTASGSGTVLLLLVAPSQAQQLAYARAFADVSIALDGPREVVSAS